MSFNKIIIVGNLGKDVDFKYTGSGLAVANFSVATTEKVKDKNGDYQDFTTWFKATVWGKQAESCNKYLSKGDKVYLEGRVREEKWNDKDGNERTSLLVNVTDVQFLGSKAKDESTESGTKTKAKSAGSEDEDMPF